MSTLSDSERRRLDELQTQLEAEDPSWARQFSEFIPREAAEGVTVVAMSLVAAVVLTILSMLFGAWSSALTFGVLTMALLVIRSFMPRASG